MSIKLKSTQICRKNISEYAKYLVLCGIFRKNNGHFTEM